MAIRRRNEGTYKDAPTKSLSAKIKAIAHELKESATFIRHLADAMGIEWVSELNDSQIRRLDIGIKAVKDGRSSVRSIAEKLNVTNKMDENATTIARDIKRLLQKLP